MALVALVAVTSVLGRRVRPQIEDGVELYPLYAFLALRFAIASIALAPAASVRKW